MSDLRGGFPLDNRETWEEPVHSASQRIVTLGRDQNVYIINAREAPTPEGEDRWVWELFYMRSIAAMSDYLTNGHASTCEEALAAGRAEFKRMVEQEENLREVLS